MKTTYYTRLYGQNFASGFRSNIVKRLALRIQISIPEAKHVRLYEYGGGRIKIDIQTKWWTLFRLEHVRQKVLKAIKSMQLQMPQKCEISLVTLTTKVLV